MDTVLNYNDLSNSSSLTYQAFNSMKEQIDEVYEKYLRLNQLNLALTNRLQNKGMTLKQFNAVVMAATWQDISNLSIEEIMNLVFG